MPARSIAGRSSWNSTSSRLAQLLAAARRAPCSTAQCVDLLAGRRLFCGSARPATDAGRAFQILDPAVDDDLVPLDADHGLGITLGQQARLCSRTSPSRKAPPGGHFGRHRHQPDRSAIGRHFERQTELDRHQRQPIDPGHRRQPPGGPQIVRHLVDPSIFTWASRPAGRADRGEWPDRSTPRPERPKAPAAAPAAAARLLMPQPGQRAQGGGRLGRAEIDDRLPQRHAQLLRPRRSAATSPPAAGRPPSRSALAPDRSADPRTMATRSRPTNCQRVGQRDVGPGGVELSCATRRRTACRPARWAVFWRPRPPMPTSSRSPGRSQLRSNSPPADCRQRYRRRGETETGFRTDAHRFILNARPRQDTSDRRQTDRGPSAARLAPAGHDRPRFVAPRPIGGSLGEG